MKIIMTVFLTMIIFLSSVTLTCQTESADADDDSDDSSDDDNDTYNSSDDTDDNPECDGNHAPELLSLAIRINGEPVDMPATVYTTDKLEFIFEYNDVDCNLNGGYIIFETSWGILSNSTLILDDIGCSSSADGQPYLKEMDPDILLYMSSIYMFLRDICEEDSNQLPLDIEVVYNEFGDTRQNRDSVA